MKEPQPMERSRISEELEKMPYEPLLPIEKKLVVWSIVLGLFLLGVLVWINQVLFSHLSRFSPEGVPVRITAAGGTSASRRVGRAPATRGSRGSYRIVI